MFVREGVGEMRISVGSAGGGDAVESGFHGAVADGVDVDDKSIFVGGDAELIECGLIEQEFTVASGVFVGLGEVRGL